jgi:S1-C subfamily serine protease
MPGEEMSRRNESGFAHVMIIVVVAVVVVVAYFAIADEIKSSSHGSTAPKTSSSGPRIDAHALAGTVGPPVVGIDATLAGGVHSHASGMLLTSAGEVLTNNHAIAGATAIAVKAANGTRYAATVRGYDVRDDVAVLGLIDAAALPAISVGDAATVSLGEPALVIGRVPGTNEIAPQAGSVTARHRQIEAGDANDPSGVETLRDMVQIDAPTRPSDSGGPVIDTHGKVIAMTTAASNGRVFHEQSAGTTFAIPIDTVVQVADRVDAGVSTATVHVGSTATLGVAVAPVSKTPTASARVVRVQPGGPAARAGLVRNTVIVSIDGVTIATAADLDAALNGRRPGAVVHVDWADTTGRFHTSAVRLASGPPA